MPIEKITSVRGNPMYKIDGHLYEKEKESVNNNTKEVTIYARCIKAKSHGCKKTRATIVVKGEALFVKKCASNDDHNHAPPTDEIVGRIIKSKVKRSILRADPKKSLKQAYDSIMNEVLDEVVLPDVKLANATPAYNAVVSFLYRERAKSKLKSIGSSKAVTVKNKAAKVQTVTIKNEPAAVQTVTVKSEPTEVENQSFVSCDITEINVKMAKRDLLDRLSDGVVIGDGGFVFSLEKRGYVKAGPWTPEAAIEHPEAVRQLHREFLRAGSDVMQAFTFYASDDKLINRGNEAGKSYTGSDINDAACKIAKEVASEGDALVAGGISQTPSYLSGKGKKAVQAEFGKQVDVFMKNEVDFLICEYFEHVEEMEWAIEVCRTSGLPVAATMCIGVEGDLHNNSVGDCARRMAIAGADVIGLNCHFDPFRMLEAIKLMKVAIEKSGYNIPLMTQPLGFHTPDATKQGFIDLPEFPFALEPRVCTRWDMQRYAREAYDLGVRYIGGCCGFESYHIRAVAEELAADRGVPLPKSSEKHTPWGEGLKMHTKPWVRARARRSYWEDLNPATGRPYSASMSKPDDWGVTAGSKELQQCAEETSQKELQECFSRADTK